MRIIKTSNYKNNYNKNRNELGAGRYENVIFMQGEEANPVLDIIDKQGEEAAVNYLQQYHSSGDHATKDDIGYGESDYVKQFGPYILVYNLKMGYVGLTYDTQADK